MRAVIQSLRVGSDQILVLGGKCLVEIKKLPLLLVERMVNDIVTLLGKSENIVTAYTEDIGQLDERLHAGVMLAVFVSTDSLLTDLQLDAESHLRHALLFSQLFYSVHYSFTQ